MKTTIDISDPLFAAAKRAAEREGTTMEALVERGLRHVLAEEKRDARFRLRNVTFKGCGLQSGVRDASQRAAVNRWYDS
jgi:Arc/MetJ family transcription regulator